MKTALLVLIACVGVVGLAYAGNRDVDIQENKVAYDSDKAAKADPDYLSPELYSNQLAACNNFADLKALLIKVQKSDAAKTKASKAKTK